MASLNEFLALRHRALARALAETRRQLSSIEEEISQIERAAKAANVNLDTISENTKQKDHLSGIKLPKTIKEAAIEVLTDEPIGMAAKDILKSVNRKLGTDYPRSSLSPQLSRLKGDGIVYREGDRWVLAMNRSPADSSSLNENGASEDAPRPYRP